MSSLNLTKDESKLLIDVGWSMTKSYDGPEFFMDFGHRQVTMNPVIMRRLNPMSFRTQARRYDLEYNEVAKTIGWGGDKFFSGDNFAEAMDTFKIDLFDQVFAKKITMILEDYALNVNPVKIVAESIERRKAARLGLDCGDLIDYAYLGRTEDLIGVSLDESDEGKEYLYAGENPELLEKAIAISKRAQFG